MGRPVVRPQRAIHFANRSSQQIKASREVEVRVARPRVRRRLRRLALGRCPKGVVTVFRFHAFSIAWKRRFHTNMRY